VQTWRDVKRFGVGVLFLLVVGLAVDCAPGRRSAAAAVLPPLAVVTPRPPAKPGTTLLVLRFGPRGASLVSFAEKPPLAEDRDEGNALWIIEDATTGARLDEGCFELPRLCTCALGHDHVDGCVVVRHEAVFRLKVPRKAPRERLRLLSAAGAELGSFLLEESS
jgi:hypothetical protein